MSGSVGRADLPVRSRRLRRLAGQGADYGPGGPPYMLAALLVVAGFPACAQTQLDDLERMALAANPAIAQSEAGVRAASGRARQAGLYPNPILGATGDHNTPALDGGSLGGFAEQRFVLGNKLGLARKAGDQDRMVAEEMQKATRVRILIQVRTLFYRGLGEQRLLEVRKEMAELAGRTVQTLAELNNVGQADRPDLLVAELEARRADLGVTMAQNALDRTWRDIAAVLNQPGLQRGTLQGDLEAVPKLDAEQALARVLSESPELRSAQILADRSGTMEQRARAEWIPDVRLRGGIRYNRELLDHSGRSSVVVGNEGFFDAGIEIPLFNRNQGSIAAARADAEQARLGVERERMALRQRFAAVYREYSDASAAVAQYRAEMIPRAREAFEMYTGNFRQMAVSYPQVLSAQRSYIQLQDDYVVQLTAAWRAALEIDGLLLE